MVDGQSNPLRAEAATVEERRSLVPKLLLSDGPLRRRRRWLCCCGKQRVQEKKVEKVDFSTTPGRYLETCTFDEFFATPEPILFVMPSTPDRSEAKLFPNDDVVAVDVHISFSSTCSSDGASPRKASSSRKLKTPKTRKGRFRVW